MRTREPGVTWSIEMSTKFLFRIKIRRRWKQELNVNVVVEPVALAKVGDGGRKNWLNQTDETILAITSESYSYI